MVASLQITLPLPAPTSGNHSGGRSGGGEGRGPQILELRTGFWELLLAAGKEKELPSPRASGGLAGGQPQISQACSPVYASGTRPETQKGGCDKVGSSSNTRERSTPPWPQSHGDSLPQPDPPARCNKTGLSSQIAQVNDSVYSRHSVNGDPLFHSLTAFAKAVPAHKVPAYRPTLSAQAQLGPSPWETAHLLCTRSISPPLLGSSPLPSRK